MTSSRRYPGAYQEPPPNNGETHEQRRLYVRSIGNRTGRTSGLQGGGDDVLYYCTNNLNQYRNDGRDRRLSAAPPATESFTYFPDGHPEQNDGNLLQDGTHKYTYDAENRLIRVEPASSPVDGDQKLEFAYDYMGRRVHKSVETYYRRATGPAGPGNTTSTTAGTW